MNIVPSQPQPHRGKSIFMTSVSPIDTPEKALQRILQILDQLAPLTAQPLPMEGMDRRLFLAKFRDAGVEIASLAHWSLRPIRRQLPFEASGPSTA
jgi:hypothetical protein